MSCSIEAVWGQTALLKFGECELFLNLIFTANQATEHVFEKHQRKKIVWLYSHHLLEVTEVQKLHLA